MKLSSEVHTELSRPFDDLGEALFFENLSKAASAPQGFISPSKTALVLSLISWASRELRQCKWINRKKVACHNLRTGHFLPGHPEGLPTKDTAEQDIQMVLYHMNGKFQHVSPMNADVSLSNTKMNLLFAVILKGENLRHLIASPGTSSRRHLCVDPRHLEGAAEDDPWYATSLPAHHHHHHAFVVQVVVLSTCMYIIYLLIYFVNEG